MKSKEKHAKEYLMEAIEEDVDYKVPYRHETMESFHNAKCDNKVTAFAIEMVTAVYRIWCDAQKPNDTSAMALVHKLKQLTLDADRAFKSFSNGNATKQEHMQSVITAYQANTNRQLKQIERR